MSKNLILIISIFAFWLYIYLTNIKKEEEKQEKTNPENFADDGIKYTGGGGDFGGGGTTRKFITSPVDSKTSTF